MNVYLDDDIAKGARAARLQKAGHQVVLPASIGKSGASDARHLFLHLAVAEIALHHHASITLRQNSGMPGIIPSRRCGRACSVEPFP